jgi:hypothetical protein
VGRFQIKPTSLPTSKSGFNAPTLAIVTNHPLGLAITNDNQSFAVLQAQGRHIQPVAPDAATLFQHPLFSWAQGSKSGLTIDRWLPIVERVAVTNPQPHWDVACVGQIIRPSMTDKFAVARQVSHFHIRKDRQQVIQQINSSP